MSSSKNKEFEDNVVFDDDESCFSPAEAEFTVTESEPVFTLTRLWNAILWTTLGVGAFGFSLYHAWLMGSVHEATTSFSRLTLAHFLRLLYTTFFITMGLVAVALTYMVFFSKSIKPLKFPRHPHCQSHHALNQGVSRKVERDMFANPPKPLCTTYRFLLICIGAVVGFLYFDSLMRRNDVLRDLSPVEREISFRTECGFYYSYYKQLVHAPSFFHGLRELTNDLTSEHPTPVNALARFNIHPEVVLAFLYRFFGNKNEDPIFFYISWVWFLQGIQVFALFLLAALVCRSVTGGFLSTLLFSHIRPFATRAYFTVSLRENFSMPFFWLRLVFLTLLFRSQLRGRQRTICLWGLTLSTFIFSTTWQLSPFLLFAQGLPMFGGAMLNAIEMSTVESVMSCDALVLFVVGMLHFAYPLFLSSPAITCAIIVVLSNRLLPPPAPNQRRFFPTAMRCICVVLAALVTSGIGKTLLGAADDKHVFKLFLAKLNLGYDHDFDVNMYLASSVFRALPPSFYVDMTFGAFMLYPIYGAVHIVFLLGVLKVFEDTTVNRPLTEYEAKKKDLDVQAIPVQNQPSLLAMLLIRRPELSMHALVCTPMAALGMFIQRLQLLWTPHMCVFYAWVLTTPAVYTLLPLPMALRRWLPRIMRYALPIFVMLIILSGYIPAIRMELQPEMRQTFADPDAVGLMHWIANKSREAGVFTGSMQLMSAIRLSTGRAITNHPHYENLDLREKTRVLYQAIYGRSKVSETYDVMRNKFGVDYIVIEYSICFAPNEGHPFAAFRMVDMLDAANGDQPEQGPFAYDPRLRPPVDPEKPKRRKMFCELVAPDQDDTLTHVVDGGLTNNMGKHVRFVRVFKNPTFFIYEVMH